MMEIDILDALSDFGYDKLNDEDLLKKAIDDGLESVEFCELTSWLSKKLKGLCKLAEYVNPITGPNDADSFLLDVSSFLKELGCPHSCLTEGPYDQRLGKRKNRTILLGFLCSELRTACLINAKHNNREKSLDIKLEASSSAQSLQTVIDTLDVTVEPSENLTDIMAKINSKAEEVVKNSKCSLSPMLTDELSESQWKSLELIHKDMQEEYEIRRQMLLTRVDVTIQSFKWGENSKGKNEDITKVYQALRPALKKTPDVKLSDVIAARTDIAVISKTSSADLRKNTSSAINRIVIGSVPDRGGRPEDKAPPVEDYGLSKRQLQGRGGHGRSKFRGRGNFIKKGRK